MIILIGVKMTIPVRETERLPKKKGHLRTVNPRETARMSRRAAVPMPLKTQVKAEKRPPLQFPEMSRAVLRTCGISGLSGWSRQRR